MYYVDKHQRLARQVMCLAAMAAFAAFGSTGSVMAAPASGVWNNPLGGSWGVDTNWVNNVIADGAGNVADFSDVDITTTRTITLDQDRTIGRLIFADNNSQGSTWNLSGTPTLTLDNGGSSPTITMYTDVLIGVVLTGTNGFTVDNNPSSKTLTLSNTANTLSGTINFSRGTLRIRPTSTGATNLGPGEINIASASNLDFGGYTYSNVANTINANRGTLLLGLNGKTTLTGTLNLITGDSNPVNVNFGTNNNSILTIGATGQVIGNRPLSTSGTGTLVFLGNKTGTGTLSIANTVRLGGTGSITGNTTVSGKLAPGWAAGDDAVGVLSFVNNLTLSGSAAAGTFDIRDTGVVRGTDYDGVNVGGNLTYAGTLSIIADLLTDPAYVFDLFNVTGTVSGGLAAVNIAGDYALSLTNNAGVWTGTSDLTTFTFTQATGDLIVTIIPEPASIVLLAIGGLMTNFRRRRHQ